MIIIDPFSLTVLPVLIYIITKNIYVTLIVLLFCIRFMNSPDLSLTKTEPGTFYAVSSGYINWIRKGDTHTTISFFLNVFDNHTQYIPVLSELHDTQHFNGTFVPAYREHSINNTRVKHTLYNPTFDFKYNITQITGILTRRILTFNKPTDKLLLPGSRLGFIVLGSRVDISIPNNNIKKVLIEPNQHVQAMAPIVQLQI
jgi:phosphatidylserine decarboxylase precursor-related protein